MEQQITIEGKSDDTLKNYSNQIAKISLHFGKLPIYITNKQINKYLYSLASQQNCPSRSYFKHMVYGLRYYFRHIGKEDRAISLPSIKEEFHLPVILNRSELKKLFVASKHLKHRVVLALVYSAGL